MRGYGQQHCEVFQGGQACLGSCSVVLLAGVHPIACLALFRQVVRIKLIESIFFWKEKVLYDKIQDMPKT